MAGKHVVVVGATGAVGQNVVGHLLTSGQWERVVAVGRRKMTVPESFQPSDFKATLEQVEVDMDKLETQAAPAFSGADAVFCCLGTTRKVAGSADQFLKVDLEYVEATAKAAKAGGARHFSLLTAQGSNPNVWANKWALFHPLLYMKAKGQAEETAKGLGFPSLSIFRPGLIERGEAARGLERAFSSLVSSIPAIGLAKLMVSDAEAALSRPAGEAAAPTAAQVFEMPALLKALKENRPPQP